MPQNTWSEVVSAGLNCARAFLEHVCAHLTEPLSSGVTFGIRIFSHRWIKKEVGEQTLA